MKKGSAILLLSVFLAGCLKDKSGNDHEAPVIQFLTPVNNAVYAPGATIKISGIISDNDIITEAHVHVTDVNSGFNFIDIHMYPNAKDADFSNQFLRGTAGIDYKI